MRNNSLPILFVPTEATKLSHITHHESRDFEPIVHKYDSPDTFFYVDPPYWDTEHYYTEGKFSQQDHRRLADVLSRITGKFALSYYDFPELHDMYPQALYRWESKEFLAPMSAGAALARIPSGNKTKVDTAKHRAVELLILNY